VICIRYRRQALIYFLQIYSVRRPMLPNKSAKRPKSKLRNGFVAGSREFLGMHPSRCRYLRVSREAKRDPRLREVGKLVGFQFQGKEYPISPTTVFYDWLYFKALYPHRDWIRRREHWAGYTDIEFNPERSINCQARSFAAFIALQKRDLLENAMSSFDDFMMQMQSSSI
jgi:hypothetical protein